MTTIQSSNAYQSAAQALQTSANLPLHERIFCDALKDARNRAVSGNDSKLLSKLSVIRDETSVKAVIQQELEKGVIGSSAGKRVSRRVARFCEKVDRLGDLALRISEARMSSPFSTIPSTPSHIQHRSRNRKAGCGRDLLFHDGK